MAKAEHRIEECFKRSKSEAGLGSYQVRNWLGWHHHQALSLIATWFLMKEADAGIKVAPALTVPQVRLALAMIIRKACGRDTESRMARERTRWLQRSELDRLYYYKALNQLPPLKKRPPGELRQ